MDGVQRIGFSAAILPEKGNHFFIEIELSIPVVAEVLKAKTVDKHGRQATGCKLRARNLTINIITMDDEI